MNAAPPASTQPGDMAGIRRWTGGFLVDPGRLPVSFRLDGQSVIGIPEAWQPSSSRRRIDANIVETVFEGREPATGLALRVECAEYLDYPVVEWTAWLTNQGKKPTPILDNVLALDGTFAGAEPVLWHCNGDFSNEAGYTPAETPLAPGTALRFAPAGGRPCDRAFPYYRIAFQGCGLTLAVGWPGQWRAEFTGTASGVQVRAGQEQTHLRLLPGETIRTPRMTLMAWAGDPARAVNLWRRWYRAHLLPRPDGQPLKPLLAFACADAGEEMTGTTEENQIRYQRQCRERGIACDVWWIDAGWYSCRDEGGVSRWKRVGTWEPDPVRFPNGLKPVADAAAANGADLLIWFEPERVHVSSRLYAEHPEWTLATRHPDPWILDGESELWITGSRLLNLGIPECRRWLTDFLCQAIRENGIRTYRQDFNINPLTYWRDNDAPDRQGMNENLHVQGYLQLWDDLLARNPGLWIDSCASGGRRNDLETLRRSVPLHYSDHGYGCHRTKTGFRHTLHAWMPYFKESTLSWEMAKDGTKRDARTDDSFSFHCGMAAMMFPILDIRRDDLDYGLAGKMIAVWRRAAPIMLSGDYYPHTAFHRSAGKWVAWQFDCPEELRGFIQAIRLPECPEETLVVRPEALRPDAVYLFENPESGEQRELPGQAVLRDGFAFALPKREGAVWFYRVK